MHRVLVTGGLGFIGSHIVDFFLNNGDEVTLIDNLSSNVLPPEYYQCKERAKVLIGEIADISSINDAFSSIKYDYIFHFAANASVPKSVENEDLNFRSNVIGTYNIMKEAVKQRSSVILASTSAIYGEYNGKAVEERSPKRPISPYGLSKLIDEYLCFHYSRIHGSRIVALRFFNVYGPRQRRYVMSDFMEKLINTKFRDDIVMLGTGNEIRDFINIRDAVKAIVLPLKYEDMWGKAYNVGSGIGIKIKDVLSVMLEELGLNYTLSFSGKSWQGDISGICADIRKIQSLGFEPVVDLRSGLREYIKTKGDGGILC